MPSPSQTTPSGRLSPERPPSTRGRSKTPPSGSPKVTPITVRSDAEWSTIVAPNASILDPGPSIPSRPIPRRSNSGSSVGRSSPTAGSRGDLHISGERESKRSPSHSPKLSPIGSKHSSPTRHGRTSSQGSEKKVHFTPSVIGGSVTTGSQPGSPQQSYVNLPPQPGSSFSNSLPLPPAPPPSAPAHRAEPALRSPPLRCQPPAPPPARVVLTPALILQTQKHCRLASSALDYEDAETAKKELRAALALLGD